MTYSCETTDKGTAEITCIVADDSVTAVSVPSSIEHGGQTYKVTELAFSSGIVAENVEQLTLPDTLENVRGWYFRKFVKVKELHILAPSRTSVARCKTPARSKSSILMRASRRLAPT